MAGDRHISGREYNKERTVRVLWWLGNGDPKLPWWLTRAWRTDCWRVRQSVSSGYGINDNCRSRMAAYDGPIAEMSVNRETSGFLFHFFSQAL